MAGIYRRGSTWWGRVQRQGKDLRTSLDTGDRRVAEKRLRLWLEEMDAVAWGEKPRRLFDEAVRKFIREHLPTLKPGSAKRYGVSIRHLHAAFGGKSIDRIRTAELSDFETARRSAGAAAPTIRRDLACLSSILSSCEEWEWITDGSNPVPSYLKRRRKRGLKEAPARERYLSPAEEERLLAAASPSVRAAVMTAIDTGLRREELFSLTWDRVDLKRGLVTTTTDTKSGRARVVPLAQRSAQAIARLPRHLKCPYVFWHEMVGADHKVAPVRYVQMEKGFKGACIRAGLCRIAGAAEDGREIKRATLRWHDLRRTAGCRWLQRDRRTMEEVSRLLGHSSVQVTEQRYAFLDMQKVAQEVAQMPAHSAEGESHG